MTTCPSKQCSTESVSYEDFSVYLKKREGATFTESVQKVVKEREKLIETLMKEQEFETQKRQDEGEVKKESSLSLVNAYKEIKMRRVQKRSIRK